MVENDGVKQGKNMPFCPVFSTGLEIQVLRKKFAAGHKLPSVQACTSLDLNQPSRDAWCLATAVGKHHGSDGFMEPELQSRSALEELNLHSADSTGPASAAVGAVKLHRTPNIANRSPQIGATESSKRHWITSNALMMAAVADGAWPIQTDSQANLTVGGGAEQKENSMS